MEDQETKLFDAPGRGAVNPRLRIEAREGAGAAKRRMSAPLPHEHGAWVILYAPLLIGFCAARPFRAVPALLLLAATTGAYLARHAASLLIRRRGQQNTAGWLGIYSGVTAIAVIPLILVYHRLALLVLAAIAAALFAVHSLLPLIPSRKRLDRSSWGEVLGVAALALTAPAGYAACSGALDGRAWYLWLICMLYFSSGIFFVKALLNTSRLKKATDRFQRLSLLRDTLGYHALMIPLVLLLAAISGGGAGVLLAVAYVPAMFRGLRAALHPPRNLPSLTRVGIGETLYSAWFVALIIASQHFGR